MWRKRQGGVIDVALCGAVKEAIAVCIVHWRIGLQPCDEIRIGQNHLAVGFEIRQPRSHVGADLIARAARPVQDQRLLPELADVAQKRLVALMHDVHISETQPVELADQIAVEIRPLDAFIDAPHRRAGRQADSLPVRADLFCNGGGHLDGEARTDGRPRHAVTETRLLPAKTQRFIEFLSQCLNQS